jgi:hypothetical protein
VFSISRLLIRQKPVQWVVGLHSAGQSSILLKPGSKPEYLTRLSSVEDASFSALAAFVMPASDEDVGSSQPTAIGVVISNRFCRYLVVPWSESLLAADAGKAYLQSAFVEVYGEGAREWDVVCQDVGYGRPRLACAIEAELLRRVRSACADRELRLAFVRPYFDVALDHFRGQMTTGHGALAVVEDDVVSIGSWVDGAIVEIDVEPCVGDWRGAVSAWQARNDLIGGETTEIFVAHPPAWLFPLDGEDAASDWRFLVWPEAIGALIAEHPSLALAACAL